MLVNQTISALSPLLGIVSNFGTFQFNGTSVGLRANTSVTAPLAPVNVTVDGARTPVSLTGIPKIGDTTFFTQTDLSQTEAHELTIDAADIISQIVFSSELDASTSFSADVAYLFTGNTQGRFTNSGNWQSRICLGPGRLDTFQCNTASESGASFTLRFKADGIILFGALEHAGSGYSVSLDGGPFVSYSGRNNTKPSTVSLAQWTNIGKTEHVVTVRNEPDPNNPGKLEFNGVTLFGDEADMADLVDNTQVDDGASKQAATVIIAVMCSVFFLAICWLVRGFMRDNSKKPALPTYSVTPPQKLTMADRVANFKAFFTKSPFTKSPPPASPTSTFNDLENGGKSGQQTIVWSSGDKDGLKPSEYGEPVPPALALELKNLAKARKEAKKLEKQDNDSNASSSRTWNLFRR